MTGSQWVVRGLAVGALAVTVTSGFAAASTLSKATSYTACASSKHVLSVEKSGKCPKRTKKVTIAARGPAGTAGKPGAQGKTGAQGKIGAQGPAGTPPAPDLSRVAELNWWGGSYGGSSYGFDSPIGIVFDGTHLWITNNDGNSVTEITTTGSHVQTLSAATYGFNQPRAIGFDGTHLWVVNSAGGSDGEGSLTEINPNGSLVKTIDNSDGGYDFDFPSAIAFSGSYLWVTNQLGNSVTMMHPDGSLNEVCSAPDYTLNHPDAIAFDGTNLWVTNNVASGSVTELNGTSGDQLNNFANSGTYSFDFPDALAFDGSRVWVVSAVGGMSDTGEVTGFDVSGGSVITLNGNGVFSSPTGIAFNGNDLWVVNTEAGLTEFDPSGTVVRQFNGNESNPYGFDNPDQIAFDGAHLWVTNISGESVTDIPAAQ
jgi:hypothetical protein